MHIQLAIPYRYRKSDIKNDMVNASITEQAMQRQISIAALTAIINSRYPNGVGMADCESLGRIQEHMENVDLMEIPLSEADALFMRRLCFSDEAREQIKIRPDAAAWVMQFMKELDRTTKDDA